MGQAGYFEMDTMRALLNWQSLFHSNPTPILSLLNSRVPLFGCLDSNMHKQIKGLTAAAPSSLLLLYVLATPVAVLGAG